MERNRKQLTMPLRVGYTRDQPNCVVVQHNFTYGEVLEFEHQVARSQLLELLHCDMQLIPCTPQFSEQCNFLSCQVQARLSESRITFKKNKKRITVHNNYSNIQKRWNTCQPLKKKVNKQKQLQGYSKFITKMSTHSTVHFRRTDRGMVRTILPEIEDDDSIAPAGTR